MTVESATNKAGPFEVAASFGTFPRNFLAQDETHVRVIRVRGGEETDLTSGVGHTGIGVFRCDLQRHSARRPDIPAALGAADPAERLQQPGPGSTGSGRE
ncbi:hypothetical protein [Paracoccus beibuensis]|uniref:hypothetical protein n=1 Tax=Paracoccus beibuensis TaxID=547602 RepID=UPI00223F988D|nr:hypothetical protein [Paracoccus beibuensis]